MYRNSGPLRYETATLLKSSSRWWRCGFLPRAPRDALEGKSSLGAYQTLVLEIILLPSGIYLMRWGACESTCFSGL